MKHNRIVRGLVMILVIALVVICVILACPPVRAVECRLEGMPVPTPWEPDPADIAYVSRTIWGETRGCPTEEQEGTGWCIILRKRSSLFPDTIEGVVLQPNQWQGYSPNNPAEPFRDMARDILIRDHNGEAGPLPEGFFWCSGDGKHQTFRDSWIPTEDTEYWP